MLEELVQRIPYSLRNVRGDALQSGRTAFDNPSDIYIIGYHPGGDPEQFPHRVGERLDWVLNHEDAAVWSSYLDESWDRKPPGSTPMQKRMNHLFHGLVPNLRAVPASHLIFRCWDAANEPSAAVKREWAEECWHFHKAVINRLDVKIVVCLGSYARYWVLKKEQLTGEKPQQIDSFTAQNKWAWTSYAYQSGDRYILTLTHPTWANWKNPNSDPTELVRRTLAKVRG